MVSSRVVIEKLQAESAKYSKFELNVGETGYGP